MLKRLQSMKTHRAEASAWQQAYDALAPRMGDPAPDFALRDVTGEYEVRLFDLCEKKPVALIFGSFT